MATNIKPSRVCWAIMLGDGSGLATSRLYTIHQARRFVRLAARFKIDVYATQFGHVTVSRKAA